MERVYVFDTNILVDYPEIIPETEEAMPQIENPTIDLSGSHLVIPTAVVRELSSFKKEKSERGKVARVLLKRMRELFCGNSSMVDYRCFYELGASIWTKAYPKMSILPVSADYTKDLPFRPADDDMDGQIILATMSAEMHLQRQGIDFDVTLLTNDNGLAIRATARGISTMRFGCRLPEPYTGRRELYVPDNVYERFLLEHKLRLAEFQEALPEEPLLVANEFVVFHAAGYAEDNEFSNVGRYDAGLEAIVPLKYADAFPVTPKNVGQVIYAEALMHPSIAAVVCSGPAGCGKTYLATVFGYSACQAGLYIGVTVVPCATSGRIGALPGDLNEKMDPEVQPYKNALRNYLLTEDEGFQGDLKRLRENGAYEWNDGIGKASLKNRLEADVEEIWEKWFSNIPIENARGRDFTYELALYDEFQDQNVAQADTLIKRIGREGKIVITGDIEQIHEPYLDAGNNGLVYASELLFDNPMVAQIHFTEDEVVRHPLVRMVAERQRLRRTQRDKLTTGGADVSSHENHAG